MGGWVCERVDAGWCEAAGCAAPYDEPASRIGVVADISDWRVGEQASQHRFSTPAAAVAPLAQRLQLPLASSLHLPKHDFQGHGCALASPSAPSSALWQRAKTSTSPLPRESAS